MKGFLEMMDMKKVNEARENAEYCSSCGIRLPEEKPKFCPECGTKL